MIQSNSREYRARRVESPENSYSRQLDNMVAAQEPPYGYTDSPPLMGHENKETLENIRLQKIKRMK